MKDINTLVIADVHGRLFWKQPVEEVSDNNPDADIVFLGDYLSPYTFEEQITPEEAVFVLKNILNIAKNNSKVHLLIGNHDCPFFGPSDTCECRLDWENKADNTKLYRDNEQLFNICYQKEINDKKFLFSHAGYVNDWVKNWDLFSEMKDNNICDFLNTKFHEINSYTKEERNDIEIAKKWFNFWSGLSLFDSYRGNYYSDYGSIVWNDVRTHIGLNEFNDNEIQIFGHTWIKKPINIKEKKYCLDCCQAFYIDNQGNVRYYDNDDIIERMPER